MHEPTSPYRQPDQSLYAPIPGYLLAIAVVALATLARYITAPYFGADAPLLLYWISIFLAARYGGLRSGLLATLLSALVATWLFMEPHNIFRAEFNVQVRVLIFFGEGFLISWLCESLHVARRKAEANLQQAQMVRDQLQTEIDERRQTQESLKRATESLKEGDRRKDEFLAILAHELRNPLAPIGNALQLLGSAEDNEPDEETANQARDVIRRQFAQMVRLIDDLMDVSRITHGRLELRRDRVELATALDSAIETSRPLIESLGHQLNLPDHQRPIYLDADLARLSQVFANLLNNAAKYTQPGGQIWIGIEQADGQVVVSVRDSGIGIPREMLSSIFELFAQANRSLNRSRGGLGIGLTLVKRLVELHGGSIEAESGGEGQGSQFRVRLPVLAPTIEAPRGVLSGNGLTKTACAGRRILAADDNEDSANTLSLLLKRLGGQVRTAYDGRAALEAAAEFRPELAFLDIGMPHLDGYEVASRIREQPWGKQIVLIALTGWGQAEDRRRSRAAGFDHHLVKPVEQESLKSLFAELQASSAMAD